jgi:maleylpyruvate isomerase
MVLNDYFRSSASFRVRIALNLKGVSFSQVSHHLRRGEQRLPAFTSLNAQGLVPALETGGVVLTQSLAIIEYLDDLIPTPSLLCADALGRARVRSLAMMVACDAHPITNLRVLEQLRATFGADEAAIAEWFRHWAVQLLQAMDCRLSSEPETGAFCHGESPTIADVCLVPQALNGERFGVDWRAFPAVARVVERALSLEAFRAAAPALQPDAEL